MTMIVRLTSGEEILAKVTEEDDHYTIDKPALILPTGNQSIGLAPWLPYADHDGPVKIGKNFVVFCIKPHDELANEYSTAFGSGLVVPPKGAVTPPLTLTE